MSVAFPWWRHQVVVAMRDLSSPDEHRKWLETEKNPGPEDWPVLTLHISVLFDDTEVLPEPTKSYGLLLPHEHEPVRALGRLLDGLIDDLRDQPDSAYLLDPRWPQVVHAADMARRVMEQSPNEAWILQEDIDRLITGRSDIEEFLKSFAYNFPAGIAQMEGETEAMARQLDDAVVRHKAGKITDAQLQAAAEAAYAVLGPLDKDHTVGTRPESARLLDELEETLAAEDAVALYDFSWTLRGFDPNLRPDEIEAIAEYAYSEFRARHPLRLVWMRWPWTYLEDAEPGTVLDFDLDPEAEVDKPYLVLIPDKPATP